MKGLWLGKAPDMKGLPAEMRKECAGELRRALLHLYITVLQRNAPSLASLKSTIITIRLVCTIPLLHELVSRLLYNRLQPTRDSHQTADQVGLKPGHSNSDHLVTFHLLRELLALEGRGRAPL
eukprot:3688902-Pyramimonas_sp.AAC.1